MTEIDVVEEVVWGGVSPTTPGQGATLLGPRPGQTSPWGARAGVAGRAAGSYDPAAQIHDVPSLEAPVSPRARGLPQTEPRRSEVQAARRAWGKEWGGAMREIVAKHRQKGV